MGNNISSNKSDAASSKKSRSVQGQRRASSVISKRITDQQQQQQENVNFGADIIQIHAQQSINRPGKRPLQSTIEPKATSIISEKQRQISAAAIFSELAMQQLDKPSVPHHHKRMKSQGNSRQGKTLRERYHSSTISASGFSSTIGDPFYISSMLCDSTMTDLTNVSSFSVSSFLDKAAGEDNNYIMAIPDTDFTANKMRWSTELASTTQDILDLLVQHPETTYDILTRIFGSERMRSNAELQREAFHAAETWSLRPADVSAKIIVACCKLCGWGTSKNPTAGFNEIQALAKRGVWEAFYYLGQCLHYGVEQQASDGYNLSSGRPLLAHVTQPIDRDQAIYWYRKVIETSSHASSERVQFYVAEAQFRIAAINFASGKISLDNVDENVDYLKQSAAAGNRKSEFSLGLLLETGAIQDATLCCAKDYYTKSADKGYVPSQIQLATILLRENSRDGISWLSKAARLGDPRAFYHLGESYEFGRGVDSDPALAAQHYQTAADRHNHRMSEFRLGMHYLHGGLGLEKDVSKAFIYLERAAKGGYPDAQYLLGMMYRDGKVPLSSTKSLRQTSAEISKNKKEAFRWIRKAASQRMHTAITQIASCYEDGVGTPVNHSSAAEYYEIATRIPGKYLPSAQQTYARFLHKNGKYDKALEMYLYASGLERSSLNTHPPNATIARTAKRMVALLYLDKKDTTTPYQPQKAFELLTELASASEGDADALYWIAVCHEEGVPGVVETNLAKAFDHYVAAANLGSSDSQFQVGHMLCKGIGVKEDRLTAFNWFQQSAEKNNAKALYYIAIYYYNGSGSIERDHQKARIYFKRSAELGHVESMVSFAQICQEKLKEVASSLSSTEIDSLQSESTRWYTKAAKQNHTTALRELGRLYGAKGDDKISAECYLKASNLNDALSTLFLGGYYENGRGVTQNKQTALEYYVKAIQLGQPTALFAIAELYEKLEDYEKAYTYYQRVSLDSRISKNYRSSKVSRLKMALYSLTYNPNTLLSEESNTKTTIHIPSNLLLPKAEAFQILFNLAQEEKLNDAYNWIAECYQDGNGITRNNTLSIKWRIRAYQEANDIQATMKLASMYEHGTSGVEKNLVYSHQLYQICGEKNNVLSQHKLGMSFWRGKEEVIPINLGMAVIWFTQSARQGYAPSHWALGQIALENGDLHIAIAWWETAMQLNKNTRPDPINVDHLLTTTCDSEALVILGKIIQNQKESVLCNAGCEASSISSVHYSRDEAELFSRAQQENHGLALRCFGQAAFMGDVEGMYLTAQAWHKDKDYPVALEHYEKAAAHGHLPSRIMCATYQIYGLGGKETNAHAGFNELLDCAVHDPDAFLHLGRCCERGLGTFRDISKALEWYHLSIDEKDDSEAMFRVGQIYAATVKGDLDAMQWYQRAIGKDNHPRANFRIAFYYIHGIQQSDDQSSYLLLEPDLEIAAHHLRVAAKQNDQDAMFELAQLLLTLKDGGHHVSNFSIEQQLEGLRWYEIAADRGSRDAQRELGNVYHTGRGDEAYENEIVVIQQDFEKAYDYFSLAAHLGDKTSALFLGTYYEHGIGVAPNVELAQSWYTVAVELGTTLTTTTTNALPLHDPSGWWPAQLCLARVLHQNEETQSEAYQLFMTIYYTHRPEQHLAYLEFMLAQYKLHGLGSVPIQASEAMFKLLHLAEQGYLKAFFPVAQCYQNGIGTEKNLLKALEWYVLLVHNPVVAVDQDTLDEDDLDHLSRAYFHLAEFYRQGTVVTMDTEKSDMLYQIAAERGSIEAKEYICH